MTAPSNTKSLGLNYRGQAWDDGTPITRVAQPDGTYAEGVASLAYVWTGSLWVAVPGDATNGYKVQGQVAASAETATIYNGTTALTPLFTTINASSSGASTLVAAVSNKVIRVVSYVLVASGTVNVKFQSHVTPTDLTGLFYLVANTGVSSAFTPVGHFQSISGEALDINLSGNVAVGGHLTYVTV